MDADMDRLLRQDMLSFTPVSGSFDIEALAAGIAAIDFSFRDEARPERFVLVPEAASRDAIAAARRADPTSPFPMVVNVEARPDEVMIWPETYQPALLELSRKLLQWMLDNHECAIENDVGTDMLAPAG
jgi:hypothetical protein